MSEQLSPERAVCLLRAKAAELERQVAEDSDQWLGTVGAVVTNLAADIALVAQQLAETVENVQGLTAALGSAATALEAMTDRLDRAESRFDVLDQWVATVERALPVDPSRP